MKRILIFCFLLIIPFSYMDGQEYGYEARLGWIPIDALNLFDMTGEDPSGKTTYGPMKTVGIFTADFDFKMKKWLSLGAKVNYRNSWRDMSKTSNGIVLNEVDVRQAISIMPTVRFTTGYDSRFRYYATLGLGAGADISNGAGEGFVAFQITPVGISFGKKISWYLELGFGHAFKGAMVGLSWRF